MYEKNQPQALAITALTLFFLSLAVPDSSSASARVTSAELPPGALTAIRLHDASSGAGRPVSFGLPIAEGALRQGEDLVITSSDGAVVESQWSPLASWRTDGSVLHGVMAFLTPTSSDNDGIYYVKKQSSSSIGQPIEKVDIVDSGLTARVSVEVGGSSYALSVEDLLSGAVSPRLDYTHFQGPISSEFAIGGPLRLNGTGEAHRTLQAYFYVRAFKKPVENVHVTAVLENTGAFNSLSDIVADRVDVTVGGEPISGFPKSPFTIHADIRYSKRGWWRGLDELWVQHDLEYVSNTKLMPAYRVVAMSENTLSSFAQTSEWNQRRILTETNLESGGAKREIAPYDSWTAAYMVSGDRRAWNAMRTASDEYGMMVSNHAAGVVHARDEVTGMPLDLTQKGVVGRVWYGSGGVDVLNATRDGRPVAQTDIAHWPAIAYLPYLLSGESNEMENVQHSAIQVWLNEAPGGHKGTIPGRQVRWLQTRGMAWALREIINGAVVTPDHHPLRNALQISATYALEEYSIGGQQADASGEVGLWFVGGSIAFPYDSNTGVAPWMDDYMTWAVGAAYERGWRNELEANDFWTWKAQGIVKRFGTTGIDDYCWEFAARYKLRVKPETNAAPHSSWAEIFDANEPGISSCAPIGTSGVGTDRDSTDYGAQMAGPLSVAVSTGIQGAAAAWSIYEMRQKAWSGFDERPEWAIKPRGEIVRPEAPADLVVE